MNVFLYSVVLFYLWVLPASSVLMLFCCCNVWLLLVHYILVDNIAVDRQQSGAQKVKALSKDNALRKDDFFAFSRAPAATYAAVAALR